MCVCVFFFPLHTFLFHPAIPLLLVLFILWWWLFFIINNKVTSCISSYKFAARVNVCFSWEWFDMSLLKSECNLLMPWVSGGISSYIDRDNPRQTGIPPFSRRFYIVLWIIDISTDSGLLITLLNMAGGGTLMLHVPIFRLGFAFPWPPTKGMHEVQGERRGASILLLVLLVVCLEDSHLPVEDLFIYLFNITKEKDVYKMSTKWTFIVYSLCWITKTVYS